MGRGRGEEERNTNILRRQYFSNHVAIGWVTVLDGSKPSQPILVDVDL